MIVNDVYRYVTRFKGRGARNETFSLVSHNFPGYDHTCARKKPRPGPVGVAEEKLGGPIQIGLWTGLRKMGRPR